MRFVNDGLINLWAHLLARAEEIIDTHFYEVRLVANQFVDALSRLFRSLDRDGAGNRTRILDQARHIQARRGPGRALPALFSQCKFLVTTQAEDGSNSIPQVHPELSRVIDVPVRADQPGNDRLSRHRSALLRLELLTRFPTASICPFRITRFAFSIAGLPVPSMIRAPTQA